eukprot:TRINITY_DN70392_c0_g1_i1.p1 TRINITY_DN70392_c0_g1~~TRINITY_DN70392_c0_g1_i1.p1  ORF type:complete len:205 (-),score=42.62 TRINITY_DN70392_c0_g1_i1:50-664(-)
MNNDLEEPGGEVREVRNNSLQHLKSVFFDFDKTLTCVDSLLPYVKPVEDDKFVVSNIDGLRRKGFGGDARLEKLQGFVKGLQASDVTIHILSRSHSNQILSALSVLDLCPGLFAAERVFGYEKFEDQDAEELTAKQAFIQQVAEKFDWQACEVLLVDDTLEELKPAGFGCHTYLVRGRGMSARDMMSILNMAEVQPAVDCMPGT